MKKLIVLTLLIFCISFTSSESLNLLFDDLTCHYNFEEIASGYIFSAVNNNAGSIIGSVQKNITGKYGKAFNFTGDGYISIGTSMKPEFFYGKDNDSDGSFSFSSWISVSDNDSLMTLLEIRDNSTTPKGFLVTWANYLPTPRLEYVFYSGAETSPVRSDNVNGNVLATTGLHHVVFIFNNSGNKRITTYIDGVKNVDLSGTGSGSGLDYPSLWEFDTLQKFYLAARHDGSSKWNGIIDDFMLFNKAISYEEILMLYNNGIGYSLSEFIPSSSDIISYYNFEETLGTVVNDKFDNFDGIINGSIAQNVDGKIGKSYSLFNDDKIFDFNLNMNLSDFTIGFWFKDNYDVLAHNQSYPSSQYIIRNLIADTSDYMDFTLYPENSGHPNYLPTGRKVSMISFPDGASTRSIGLTIQDIGDNLDNIWKFATMSYSKSLNISKISVNANVYTFEHISPVSNYPDFFDFSNFTIGSSFTNFSIDELIIFNKSLSNYEILSLYNYDEGYAYPPKIDLNYPVGNLSEGYIGKSLQLNFTVTDANLDKVWYLYDGKIMSSTLFSNLFDNNILTGTNPATGSNYTIELGNVGKNIIVTILRTDELGDEYLNVSISTSGCLSNIINVNVTNNQEFLASQSAKFYCDNTYLGEITTFIGIGLFTKYNWREIYYSGNDVFMIPAATSGVNILENITLTSSKSITIYANDTIGNLAIETFSWDYENPEIIIHSPLNNSIHVGNRLFVNASLNSDWVVKTWIINFNGTNYSYSTLDGVYINVSSISGLYNLKIWVETDLETYDYNDSVYYFMNIPQVILLSPEDNSLSGKNRTFSCSSNNYVDGLINATLFIWNSSSILKTESKNISGITNISYFDIVFNKSETIYWNCLVCSEESCRFDDDNNTLIVDVDNPLIYLNSPVNNKIFNYSTIIFNTSILESNNLDTVFLYGNFTGTWKLNQTKAANADYNNFSLTLLDGLYKYTIAVNKTTGEKTFSQLGNYTFIVDTTKPQMNNITITTTINSNQFSFLTNIDDLFLERCYYSISGFTPEVNTSFSCNELTSATAPGFGSYVLSIYAFDIANNSNYQNLSFTTSISSGGTITGGGGSTIIQQTTIKWLMQTREGSSRYVISMLPSSSRSKDLMFENLGTSAVNLKLKCEDVRGNLCQYVIFDKETFVLPLTKEFKEKVTFIINAPLNVDKQEYLFNIIAEDDSQNLNVISVAVNFDLDILVELGTKFVSNKTIGTYKFPYILIFIFSWIILSISTKLLIFKIRKGGMFLSVLSGFLLSLLMLLFI